ncbi:Rieske (2Fe-2S) protein [Nonomuraea rhodomycinica]|uniref:Cytochrome bc1 complex Rieske iron-sulfur subunit n=1 Tax=Nonomuraea rhodomycinica TaxID=1712872 RepID=A0A7Y6MCC8_9ACTN|nr:Rieske (2Fe-2S) protein [Nonomuraea rhodomycinica]NUW41611.1 Rieske (2Fe-2S) protein [Nonomuraea rhodomycinica]
MRGSERGSATPAIEEEPVGARSGRGVGRREALGIAGAAVCGLAVAGCGAGGQESAPVQSIKGQVLAKTADVPVGGGTLVEQWKIMITQPAEGVFKAFSAICPHRGCAVGSPQDSVMTCPCHGSEFAADSGKCLKGPATAPLTAYQVKVVGDGIVAV